MAEKTIYEILTDENDVENIVLQSDDGTETEFEQLATIDLDNKLYCILSPLGEDGIAGEEAFVFEFKQSDDAETLDLVMDDDIVDKVFDEYERLCNEE